MKTFPWVPKSAVGCRHWAALCLKDESALQPASQSLDGARQASGRQKPSILLDLLAKDFWLAAAQVFSTRRGNLGAAGSPRMELTWRKQSRGQIDHICHCVIPWRWKRYSEHNVGKITSRCFLKIKTGNSCKLLSLELIWIIDKDAFFGRLKKPLASIIIYRLFFPTFSKYELPGMPNLNKFKASDWLPTIMGNTVLSLRG